MDARSICYLFNYAINMGIINNISNSLDDIDYLIDNKINLSYSLKNGITYDYDFSNPEEPSNELGIKAIRKILPVSGVIDLVCESIKLGVITDISLDYGINDLLSYDKNYYLISKADYFCFKINSEMFDDTIYKITFDKNKHNIKHKIEYASRTSLFIDTLMKRIMAKYNILLVRKASWVDDGIPSVPTAECVNAGFSHTSDSALETDMIENQLKVLINYRDNFNNTTCSENVIDDIFVNITGSDIRYGFFKIGKSDDTEPLYDVINEDVSVDDIDSLLRIRNLINDSNVKFNIFETLRNNKETNLANLISSRILEYDEKINTDPKIEFTITPLSIYCNHIVKKTATYNIYSSNEKYRDYEIEYNVEYNPTNISNAEFMIYGDGDIEVLGNDDKLVIAFDDIISPEKELNPRISSTKYASMLYGICDRYNNDDYKDVYFLNEALVKIIDNNIMPFDGILDENTYLKSQVVKGEISGKFIYIKDAVRVEDEDILGVDLLDLDKKRYVSKEYERHCDMCNHLYAAKDEIWENYKYKHLLQNDPNKRSCCDKCKGSVLDNGQIILYSAGYKEYYLDDPKELKYSEECILCSSSDEAFIFVNPHDKSRGRCKICNKYYCPKHIDINTGICQNCSGDIDKDTINDQKLLRLIKSNISPLDAINKDLTFRYMKQDHLLWVYSKRKNKNITYHFLVSEDEKYIHPLGKNTKRGEE